MIWIHTYGGTSGNRGPSVNLSLIRPTHDGGQLNGFSDFHVYIYSKLDFGRCKQRQHYKGSVNARSTHQI